jgi:hypothetical protein
LAAINVAATDSSTSVASIVQPWQWVTSPEAVFGESGPGAGVSASD